MSLKPLNRGMNLATESIDYIWTTVLDDCNDEEARIIQEIKDRQISKIEKPLYRETLEIKELGDTVQPVLTWIKRKIMLFIDDCDDDYDTAVKTGWKCFSTVREFDIDEFIAAIEVK